ncbi:MAG: peptidase [Phenylobacterium sp.]|nr:peptidase [Phenylobacterium sp.]
MTMRAILTGLAAAAALALPAHAASDWTAVGKALGKTGALQAGGVYRVGLPRSDLKVTLDGVAIKPALALGSWVAFRDMGDQAMVMGDLVLTQAEVNPVMSVLEENGIQITALHNHLLRSSPATMYMHVDGHGDAVKLAAALHLALARSLTPFGDSPPAAPAAPLALETAKLDQTIGAKGTVNGGVYQFSIPRADAPKSDGMPIPPAMGSAIAINFQPTGAGKAAITGDFVLTADEVNPVIRALRGNGIEVTAIHNHMLDDEPRLFFMHFWANADALKLAGGLRAALDHVKVAGR